jgi:hypothetical protein
MAVRKVVEFAELEETRCSQRLERYRAHLHSALSHPAPDVLFMIGLQIATVRLWSRAPERHHAGRLQVRAVPVT